LRPNEICRAAGTVRSDYFIAKYAPSSTCNYHIELPPLPDEDDDFTDPEEPEDPDPEEPDPEEPDPEDPDPEDPDPEEPDPEEPPGEDPPPPEPDPPQNWWEQYGN
jgi:hypothetical protein